MEFRETIEQIAIDNDPFDGAASSHHEATDSL